MNMVKELPYARGLLTMSKTLQMGDKDALNLESLGLGDVMRC